MALARPAVIAFAVVACAWFGLGIRQAHDTNAATSILSQSTPLRAAQAKHASDLLDSAGTLNPDREVDILRGDLATEEGELVRARKILSGVVASEPKNVNAWIAFAHASHDDRRAFFEAVSRVSELVAHLHH